MRTATRRDLAFIDQLQKKFCNAVGFMPGPALEAYVSKSCVIVATVNDQPVGYLLGRSQLAWQPLLRPIYQLCVEPAAHHRGHASALLDAWERAAIAAGQAGLQANCAATIKANAFWPSQGYSFICHLQPRNQRGREIIVWRKPLISRVDRWFIDPPRRAGYRARKTRATS